jgi:hypothetical protein
MASSSGLQNPRTVGGPRLPRRSRLLSDRRSRSHYCSVRRVVRDPMSSLLAQIIPLAIAAKGMKGL